MIEIGFREEKGKWYSFIERQSEDLRWPFQNSNRYCKFEWEGILITIISGYLGKHTFEQNVYGVAIWIRGYAEDEDFAECEIGMMQVPLIQNVIEEFNRLEKAGEIKWEINFNMG